MSNLTGNPDTDRRIPAGGGTAFVAWCLLLMAIGVFAPAVLTPEWRAYQASREALQTEQHRLEALREVVERERRSLDAIQTDPSVVARIALREYGLRPLGEDLVPVSLPVDPPENEEPFVPEAVPPPAAVARAMSYLPELNYDAVFCDEQTRLLIIAMSLGLMGVAVWLPAGRTRSRRVG